MLVSNQIDIESMVKTLLPPMSGPALRVLEYLRDLNSSTSKLAEAIGADPALATIIIRAANSPLFGMGRNITSLLSAVMTMGEKNIHDIVIAFTVSSTFNKKRSSGPLDKHYQEVCRFESGVWLHSLAVGVMARRLCKTLALRGTEEAFLCGLLHDIGKLLLLRHDSHAYKLIQETISDQELLETERYVYGYTHAEVGAIATSRWELPVNISYVIGHHHHPEDAKQAMVMTQIIYIADKLANFHNIGVRQEGNEQLTLEEAAMLRMSVDELDTQWRLAKEDLDAMMLVLH